jgi:integrase
MPATTRHHPLTQCILPYMAGIKERHLRDGSPAWDIQWRIGGKRAGRQCSETFRDPALAAKFKTDVEYCKHQYPPNYIPGQGYVTEAQMAAVTAAQEVADKPTKPFLDFAADVIDKLTGIEAKTRADYHRFVQNHMSTFPPLAQADVADVETLDAGDVGSWVNWLEDGMKDPDDEEGLRWLRPPKSPKTIANLHGLLYMIMQKSVEGERPLRKYNPCAGTQLPRLDDRTDEEMVFLTPAEYAILHQAADPTVRDVFLGFVGTGMRFSELTAQKCKDYRRGGEQSAARVQRAWKRQADNTFEVGPPKTKAGRRRVTLDEITDAVFARNTADRSPDAWTFVTRSGVAIKHNNFFARYWQPAVYRAVRCEEHRRQDREVGILVDEERVPLTNMKALRQRHLRPCGCPGTLTQVPRIHDLRHTHVAWQIAGNVPLSAIARRVGHESVNTTDKTYGHLLPELDQRQANATLTALAAAGFVVAAA